MGAQYMVHVIEMKEFFDNGGAERIASPPSSLLAMCIPDGTN